jgi:molecular chaperone DnaK (HSP70)
MDAEWEDYRHALKIYEKQQLKEAANASSVKVVAIDLGTCFTKFAVSHPSVELVISPQGDRSIFNGVVYDGNEVIARGRTALERFHYHNDTTTTQSVTMPFAILAAELAAANSASKVERPGKVVVRDVLSEALTEILDRLNLVPTTSESSVSQKNIRKVVTIPTSFLAHSDVFGAAFVDVGNHGNIQTTTSYVPEPVAAVWGAQFHNLLPENPTALVIDVGGWTTQFSVVNNDKVVDSITIPWGGEVMIEQLVGILQDESTQKNNPPLQDARSLSLLQMQARQSLVELSTKTRTSVHVPYLFADPRNHHLDTSLARSVLETAVENHLRQEIITHLDESFFSPHIPKPTDLSTLLTSVITQLLEQSRILPNQVDKVLLVGGAAKAQLVQRNLASSLQLLMGPSGAEKLLQSDEAMSLTVLGAATLPPSFDYDLHLGLVRR